VKLLLEDNTVNDADRPTQSGFGIKAMAKYYFSPDQGADKWYGAFYIRKESLTISYDTQWNNYDYESSIFAAGVQFGKKWVFLIPRVLIKSKIWFFGFKERPAFPGPRSFGVKLGTGMELIPGTLYRKMEFWTFTRERFWPFGLPRFPGPIKKLDPKKP